MIINFPSSFPQLIKEISNMQTFMQFMGNNNDLNDDLNDDLNNDLNDELIIPPENIDRLFSEKSKNENIPKDFDKDSILRLIDDKRLENEDEFNVSDLKKKSANQIYSRYLALIRKHNNQLLAKKIKNYDWQQYLLPNKIFLSYAVKDIALAVALFFWFQNHGVCLYVDYFFNPTVKKQTSRLLKTNLSQQIQQSKQFLFADSMASQIKIGTNYYIRPWCSWENGIFLGTHQFQYDLTYRINWYSISGHSNKIQLISDMKILTALDNKTKIMKGKTI